MAVIFSASIMDVGIYKNFNLNVRADSRTNIMHDLRQRALRKMSSILPRSEGPRTKTENEAFFVVQTKFLNLTVVQITVLQNFKLLFLLCVKYDITYLCFISSELRLK